MKPDRMVFNSKLIFPRSGTESRQLSSQVSSYVPDHAVGAIDDLTDVNPDLFFRVVPTNTFTPPIDRDTWRPNTRSCFMRLQNGFWILRLMPLWKWSEVCVWSIVIMRSSAFLMREILDDRGASHPHSFKSSFFSIPTQCGYCQVRVDDFYQVDYLQTGLQSMIWGLSKQGKTCKACGLSVHSKCELKVRISGLKK